MKKLILIAFCVFGFGTVFSQITQYQVISTSGDFYKKENASLSWTLGECVTETLVSTNTILTQGFQQSHYYVTAINNVVINGLKVNVFPNPSTDYITVSFENRINNQNFTIEIFDLQGKILFTDKFEADKAQLNMSQYVSGIYLLKVTDNDNQNSSNFKIQKN